MVEGISLVGVRAPVLAAILTLALLGPRPLLGQDLPQLTEEPEDTVVALVGPVQPDIYVADLSVLDGLYYVGPLRNVTNRTYSYDDQPMFTPDSRSLLYTTRFVDRAGDQNEIHRYYLSSRRETRITRSLESEYSPAPVPGDRAFSAIRVEADSTQRLWRFTMEGMDGEVLFPNLDAVGYYAWGNESTVLLYVMGSPPSIRIGHLTTWLTQVVAEDVGRSLNKIPNRNAWSFVERFTADESWINEVNIGTGEIGRIVSTVDGGEFHTWTPAGVLLMASDSRIYQWDPERTPPDPSDPESTGTESTGTERTGAEATGAETTDPDPFDLDSSDSDLAPEWQLMADLEDFGLRVGRITVSPDGSKIAIVATPIQDFAR